MICDKNDHCFTVVPRRTDRWESTRESIVVAPIIITLSREQVEMLEEIVVALVRHIGIIGECNIQYGFNAATNDYRGSD